MRLIDADALIKSLNEWNKEHYTDTFTGDDATSEFDYMINQMDEIEKIERRRHGVWAGTVCSCCGESTSFYYDCKYCPNCGAKMDEEI